MKHVKPHAGQKKYQSEKTAGRKSSKLFAKSGVHKDAIGPAMEGSEANLGTMPRAAEAWAASML
jgi:hypothetical protein